MKLFNKNKLDERQLLLRGNIYYQGLTIVSSLLIFNFYIKTFLKIDWIYGDWDYLLILFIGILWTCVRMTFCDIYPITTAKYKVFFIFTGAYGIFFLVTMINSFVSNKTNFIENNQITNMGAFMLFACIYVGIFIGYIIKLFYDRRLRKMEEEE